MDLSGLAAWIQANPIIVALFVLGAVANLAPRPHPENNTGAVRVFWLLIDRLCFLTAQAVPGRFKMFFTPSPIPPEAATPVTPASPTKKDEPT